MDDATAAPTRLVTCSICLGVLRESGWVPAEAVIRELRSFAFEKPLQLADGVCGDCQGALAARRRHRLAEAA
jgi:hypothetical protein